MDLNNKMKRKDVMKKYGISSSGHLSNIIKEEDKIRRHFMSGSSTVAKLRRPNDTELESKVLKFPL